MCTKGTGHHLRAGCGFATALQTNKHNNIVLSFGGGPGLHPRVHQLEQATHVSICTTTSTGSQCVLLRYYKLDNLTLTSSLKTACWIILRLFRPEAISSRSMADLQGHDTPQMLQPHPAGLGRGSGLRSEVWNTHLTFSLSCLTSLMLTSASSRAAQTSFSMAFNTWTNRQTDTGRQMNTVRVTGYYGVSVDSHSCGLLNRKYFLDIDY